LSLEPFDFHDGPLAFSGTAGSIQLRGPQVTLSLAAAGSLSYGKAMLQSDKPAAKSYSAF
jgi:hypothetical protein